VNSKCAAFLFVLSLPFLATAADETPRCDRCADLPKLERELYEQEYLLYLYREYTPGDPLYYYDPRYLKMPLGKRVGKRFREWLGTPAGGGEAKGGSAEAMVAYWLKGCPIVLPVLDAQGEVKYGKDDIPETKPFNEAEYRKKNCKEMADFVIAHEKEHQRECEKKWKDKTTADYQDARFIAADEVRGYREGIKNLRETIAKLASECGWTGSTNPVKKDGTKTIPTPDEIQKLKDNVRKTSAAVQKGKGKK
jgi:hypothetical protein